MPKENEFFNGFDNDIIDPDEFEEESETKEQDGNKAEDDGKSTVENEPETEDSTSNSDETEENAKTQEELEEEQKQKELHERNEREKAKRLAREQKEREEKIKKDAKLEAELNLVKTNEFTGEKITDEDDLEIYKLMKEIDDNGGDPINDLPKAIAEKNRKAREEEKKALEESAKAKQSVADEVNGFHERHKDITQKYLLEIGFDKVVDSPEYDGFTYAERVYDFLNKYNSAKRESDDNEVEKNVKENGKKMTKVPSSNSNGGKVGEKSYLEMSDEEYLKQEKENSLDFF